MQIKEAIEFLSRYLDNEHYTDKCNKAHRIAISALENQIPKKPEQTHQLNFFWCSGCNRAIKKRIENSIKDISHCPYCGQALDWGDED